MRGLRETVTIESSGETDIVESSWADGPGSPWFADPPPCIPVGAPGSIPWWYWTTRRRRIANRGKDKRAVLASTLALIGALCG